MQTQNGGAFQSAQALQHAKEKFLSHLKTFNRLMKNPQLKMSELLCWNKLMDLTTSLVQNSQNSYDVEQSGDGT